MNQPGTTIEYLFENTTGEMQQTPAMSFRCRDIGMDCSFETTGTAEQKILKKYIDHAESTHNLSVLSADVILKIKSAIKK
jgi:predicted small metal-binding protein